MEKRAQSMLLDAVLLCAARTWKPGSPFYELHVAAMRDQGQHFFWDGTCDSHRCRGAGSIRESDSRLAGTRCIINP